MDKSKKSSKASKPKGTGEKPAETSTPAKGKSKVPGGAWVVIAALVTASAAIIVALIQKVPAPTPPPSTSTLPPGCSIKNVGWTEYYIGNLGSTVSASPVLQTDCEIKIKFDLKKEDWVAAYKKLAPNQLLKTSAIKFSYTGKGAANSLEFKLIEKDPSGNETLFFVQWCSATSTAGREIVQEIEYEAMPCRDTPGSNCKAGTAKIRPELVDRIDFTVSNKPACDDMSGQGELIIKGIEILP